MRSYTNTQLKLYFVCLCVGSGLLLLLTTILSLTSAAPEQAGSFGFGGDGRVFIDFDPDWVTLQDLALQPDGKIVVVGSIYTGSSARMLMFRYTSNGDLDTTFGDKGIVITDLGHQANHSALAIQQDGKIMTVGKIGVDLALTRFNEDGSLDSSFNQTGVVTTSFGVNAGGSDLAILSDGRIVASGWIKADFNIPGDFTLSRYHPDGRLDTSLNSTGYVVNDLGDDEWTHALAVQNDNKVIVAGVSDGQTAIVRYNSDGSFDLSFNGTGVATIETVGAGIIYDIVIQSDNKILMAGARTTLARYHADGSPDNTFGNNGVVINTYLGSDGVIKKIALDKNDKFVVLGTSSNGLGTARFNSDGTLDETFGAGGIATISLGRSTGLGLAIQPDGKIIVGGDYALRRMALIRYLDDGRLDEERLENIYLPLLFNNQ